MKIFISHSSKNGELAKTFASFLGSLDSRIEVTCTSKFGTVKSAQDFKKEIENELKECDIFIPLFSNSYYLSKYSMIELGFAYARCCYEDKEISIIPFSIPPLKVSEALNKTPLNDLQVISIENREAIFHFANEIIRDRLKGDFTNDKIDKFIKHVNTLIYPINSENHEPESLPEKHAFDPEDIYNKAKSIVKVVANNCKNNKKYMDTLSSLLEEKNSPLKDSMIKKLDQLYRKHYMVELLDKLVEKHGHRFHSAANSYGNFNDLKIYAINYCVIMMCIDDWTQNKASTNDAINRISEILRYQKAQKDVPRNEGLYKYYEKINDLLWDSELPFRTGGEYSCYMIFYPPKKIDDLWRITGKGKEYSYKELFKKTEGILLDYNEIINKTPDIKLGNMTAEEYYNNMMSIVDSETEFDEAQTEFAKKIIEEMCWRNQSIYTMLFFLLHGSMRLRYSRESDRIVSCEYFRYLQYKAQVMFNNASDDQRTRLAHTLEVANVAKTVAKQLGCNWELAEAMALGHDVGHVPFGHQGEEALDKSLNSNWAGRFSHSLQSVNVLANLAKHSTVYNKFGVSGLCISRPVLEGILKHDTDNLFHDIRRASWRLQYNGWREILNRNNGENIEDENTREWEWENGLAIGGLESQIVYWADKIAYAGHNWDEFTNSGFVDKIALDVEHIIKRMHQLRHMAHGRYGDKDESDIKYEDIKTEIDLICFIRHHLEQTRQILVAANHEEKGKTKTEEERIVDTFKPLPSSKDNGTVETPQNGCSLFVKEFTEIYNKQIKNEQIELKYLTREEYELLCKFFSIANSMIVLTKIYPKPFKKSDDLVWVICRYLTDIKSRDIERALRSGLIQHSREILANDSYDEDGILESGKTAMKDSMNCNEKEDSNGTNEINDENETLQEIRKNVVKMGYIEGNIKRESAKNSSNGIVNDNNARDNRNMIKEYKKKFREKLQKKMTIRLEQDMIVEYNHISDFVATYYIGSERVRVMKQKAHLIIEKLFDFYMEHEDMLPIEYNHSIAFEAQKLSTLKDEFSDCKNKKRLIVIQYIFERIEENKDIVEIIKKMSTEIPSELISHENQLKDFIDHEDVYQIILCVFNFLHNSHNWKNNIDDNNIIDIFGYIYENIEKNIFNNNNNDDDFRKYYHGLCRHIAKARVITNYIASMTDRYAEKKYNEIVSSSTSWSVSFHE